jgi:hypothetical protein
MSKGIKTGSAFTFNESPLEAKAFRLHRLGNRSETSNWIRKVSTISSVDKCSKDYLAL